MTIIRDLAGCILVLPRTAAFNWSLIFDLLRSFAGDFGAPYHDHQAEMWSLMVVCPAVDDALDYLFWQKTVEVSTAEVLDWGCANC